MQDTFADLPFPAAGNDFSAGLESQRQNTTREGVNVRLYEPLTDRARGGQRPGLARFINQALPLNWSSGSRLIQELNTVVYNDDRALLGNQDWEGDDFFIDPSTPGKIVIPFPDSDTDPPDGPECRREGRGGANAYGYCGGDPIVRPPTGPGGRPPVYPPPPGNENRTGGRRRRAGGSGAGATRLRRKRPRIIWEDPADIVEGTALSGTQLNAVAIDRDTLAVLQGTYTYNPPDGTVLPVGENHPLHVEFQSIFPLTYDDAEATVHIDVIDGDDPDPPPPGDLTCTLVQADVSDLGFDCFAVCAPDTISDFPNVEQAINNGNAHVAGTVQAPSSGSVPCP